MRSLTALGMAHGWFRGYVLYIPHRPRAYWLGFGYRGVFRTGLTGYDPGLRRVQRRHLRAHADDRRSRVRRRLPRGGLRVRRRRVQDTFGTESWQEADVLGFVATIRGAWRNLGVHERPWDRPVHAGGQRIHGRSCEEGLATPAPEPGGSMTPSLASRPRVRGAVTAGAARTGEPRVRVRRRAGCARRHGRARRGACRDRPGPRRARQARRRLPRRGAGRGRRSDPIADVLPARPGPAIGALPLPPLLELEPALRIEAVAAVGERSATAPADAPFASAVRVDDLVWTSAVTAPDPSTGIVGQTEAVLESLRALLGAEGAALDDAVKVNIFYVGTGTAADWEVAARTRGAAVSEPAAAATGVPVPTLGDREALTSIEVWAARGSSGPPLQREHHWPEGHWDWPIHLPWKHGCRCGNLVTVGGQVSLRGSGEVVDPAISRSRCRPRSRTSSASSAGSTQARTTSYGLPRSTSGAGRRRRAPRACPRRSVPVGGLAHGAAAVPGLPRHGRRDRGGRGCLSRLANA